MRDFWGHVFAAGSFIAAFCQGCMLGLVVEGADPGDLSPIVLILRAVFPIFCGIGMIGGYALLGSSWLMLKTQDVLQTTAREVALPALLVTAGFLVIVSFFTPFVSAHVGERWFAHGAWPFAATMLGALIFVLFKLFGSIWGPKDHRPLQWTTALVVLSYLGIIASLFPYIVPYKYTLFEIANDRNALIFAGVGICIVLPIVILYLVLGYRVFRGKLQDISPPPAITPSISSRKTSGHHVDLHMS